MKMSDAIAQTPGRDEKDTHKVTQAKRLTSRVLISLGPAPRTFPARSGLS